MNNNNKDNNTKNSENNNIKDITNDDTKDNKHSNKVASTTTTTTSDKSNTQDFLVTSYVDPNDASLVWCGMNISFPTANVCCPSSIIWFFFSLLFFPSIVCFSSLFFFMAKDVSGRTYHPKESDHLAARSLRLHVPRLAYSRSVSSPRCPLAPR